MTHDTGLVEVVARVLDPEAWGFWDKMQLERDRCDETLLHARAALDAINASGTHRVAKVCQECEGNGWVVEARPIAVAVCCGNALPTGECCGNPVAGQDWEQVQDGCGKCYGSGVLTAAKEQP